MDGGLVLGGMSCFGIPLTAVHALLFGALIAATDPVAALAILSKVGSPANLVVVVDGEVVLNDAWRSLRPVHHFRGCRGRRHLKGGATLVR